MKIARILMVGMALIGCGPARPSVAVTVNGLTRNTDVVTLLAEGTAAGERLRPERIPAQEVREKSGPHFGYYLQRGLSGDFSLDLKGLDAGDCAVATGQGYVGIQGDRRHDLSITLVPTGDCQKGPGTVIVSKPGEGAGLVTSEPPGILCGESCTHRFPPGTRVKLRALAETTSRFVGWGKPCVGDSECELAFDAGEVRVSAVFSRQVCIADGWCWENPLPHGNKLFGMWGASEHDVWAVGYAGTILHWNGSSWSGHASGTSNVLHAVWGTGPRNIWVVGANGTIRSWDGTAWSTVRSPMSSNLYGLWGTDDDDAWAVGGDGGALILRWQGESWGIWNKDPLPQRVLRSIWGSGPDDAWAVGGNGTILQWDGVRWKPARVELPAGTSLDGITLYSVWGSGPNDVWAVGNDNTILHYNGAAWKPDPTIAPAANPDLVAVWGTGQNDVWAVGNRIASGAVLHYDGARWSQATDLTPQDPYNTVWGSGKRLWIAGDRGALLRRDETGWTSIREGHTGRLQAVWGSGADAVWAVGLGGAILRRDGRRWIRENSGTVADLTGVWGSERNDVWAVGASVVHRENGTWSLRDQWRMVREVSGPFTAIWGSQRNDIWTTTGQRMFRYNGAELQYHSDLNAAKAIWGTGPKDVWVIGAQGRIDHWDGTWTMVTDVAGILNAVWGSARDDVWAAGARLYRGNAERMRWDDLRIVFGAFMVNAIWGSGPTDIWFVDDNGFIGHLEGPERTKRFMQYVVPEDLRGLWGSGPKDIYAVGDAGVILRYQGP